MLADFSRPTPYDTPINSNPSGELPVLWDHDSAGKGVVACGMWHVACYDVDCGMQALQVQQMQPSAFEAQAAARGVGENMSVAAIKIAKVQHHSPKDLGLSNAFINFFFSIKFAKNACSSYCRRHWRHWPASCSRNCRGWQVRGPCLESKGLSY